MIPEKEKSWKFLLLQETDDYNLLAFSLDCSLFKMKGSQKRWSDYSYNQKTLYTGKVLPDFRTVFF